MPKTKAESKRIASSLINDGKKMLFNLLPSLENGRAFFVTLCFDKKAENKNDFKYSIEKYIKAIAYIAKKNNKSEPLEYSLVYEYGNIKGYHAHLFIWFKNNDKPLFNISDLVNKWKQQDILIQEILSPIDALRLMFYTYNISLKYINNYNASSAKVIRKRNSLKYFEPYEKITKESKYLKEPVTVEIENVDDNLKIICCSKRFFSTEKYYSSQFVFKEGIV